MRQRRGTALGSYAGLLLYAIPLAVGVLAGWLLAYLSGQRGPGPANAIGLLTFAAQAAAVVVVALMLVGWIRRDGRARAVGEIALATGVVAAFGGLIGLVITPGAGLNYRETVQMVARGTMTAALGGAAGFSPTSGGVAECRAVPGTDAVESLIGLDLGTLNGGGLQMTIEFPDPAGDASISAWVDSNDLSGDAIQPFWSGTASINERVDGDRTGRATFEGLQVGEPKPGFALAPGFPPTLSGEVAWTCGDWFVQSDVAPEPHPGSIELVVADATWEPAPEGTASCERDPEGTVTVIGTPFAGHLHGSEVSVDLDLGGAKGAGYEIGIAMRVLTAEGDVNLSWFGAIAVDALEPGGSSGRARFNDLPTDVEPNGGPPPAGWPPSLSGEISWTCG